MLTMGVLSVGGRPDITCAGFASHSILTVIRKIVMFSIVEIPNRVREKEIDTELKQASRNRKEHIYMSKIFRISP